MTQQAQNGTRKYEDIRLNQAQRRALRHVAQGGEVLKNRVSQFEAKGLAVRNSSRRRQGWRHVTGPALWTMTLTTKGVRIVVLIWAEIQPPKVIDNAS